MKATRHTWWLWSRFESWLSRLSALSSPLLFGLFLTWFLGWTVLAGVVLDALVDDVQQARMSAAAGRLMPAVGVLFALLTAFVITNQWNRSRSGEGIVGSEADAGIRLALASRSPGIDGPRVRSLLADYLRSVLTVEWDTLLHERAGSGRTAAALSRLERTTRAEATAPGVAGAVSAASWPPPRGWRCAGAIGSTCPATDCRPPCSC